MCTQRAVCKLNTFDSVQIRGIRTMRSEKILLFENHTFYSNRIRTGLFSQGYQVLCHGDLERLDEIIQVEIPYLVIIGIQLEGTDPYLVDRNSPVEPLERMQALQQGCADILLKRVDRLEVLLQRVHDLLRPGSVVDRRALLRGYAEEIPTAL
jgi:DNA-binding response OmpR family regulator